MFRKRLFDILIAVIALIVLCLPLIFLFFLVRMKLGGPVLFRQFRSGINGTPFQIIKFRSMKNQNLEGPQLSDSDRLTPFGLFLRSSSLDELPELWNVLKGDMSLVGPRPLLVDYLPLYSNEQLQRHNVRPGITGWAQINGRNSLSWEEKFELDIWYVRNQSFSLDVRILWLTVKKVLVREGISAAGEVTMPRFQGSAKNEDPL